MPRLLHIACLALLVAGGGCAHDRPLLDHGLAFPGDGPPATVAAATEPGPPVVEHTLVHESFGAPVVAPAGIRGPHAVAETDGPYLLDTGDRLRIFVYGQPNLSRLYTVDHGGFLTVPLIGAVKARGLTTFDIEGVIKRRLGAEFVKNPQVTVDVHQNRPFFILGEVRTAGQYPYVSGMTVETAVAIAGGYSERASDRSFRITRRIDGLVETIEAPADYPLQPGDTVFVRERFF
jgi:polysaccharide export outer membrane protein